VGNYEAQQNSLSETEVSIKMQAYHKSDTNIEMIEVLTTISQVSARMARNLKVLAAARQSEKGERTHEQNGRHETDNRRSPQCCCRY